MAHRSPVPGVTHPTETIAVDRLRPHPRNYKRHPPDQIRHLTASLKQFGQFKNVVIAKDNTILAGHGVVKAIQKLRWAEASVVRLDLDPMSPRALKLVALDNEIPRLGETDDQALGELLREVSADVDAGLLGTGFTDDSLADLLAGSDPTPPATSDLARIVEISDLKAPFPWFGGKSRAAPIIWGAFGDVGNYVEAFAGSLATLLARPGGASGIETVNDLDAWIANFWRAVGSGAEAVAEFADWPVNESDLHARHGWLLKQEEWRQKMRDPDEPDFFDAKIAGWWVWGCCLWIGSGWCDERFMRTQVKDPRLAKDPPGAHSKRMQDPSQQIPHLRGSRGVHTDRVLGPTGQIPHLSTSGMDPHAARSPSKKKPFVGHGGRGVHRPALSAQIPFLGHAGKGVHRTLHGGSCAATRENLLATFAVLRDRMRRVRVVCGSWERVLTDAVTTGLGVTGVLLDPPYSEGADDLYGNHDKAISARVRAWAIEHGNDPLMRIVFCGYDGEHEPFPEGWRRVVWKAHGGYGPDNGNSYRERIWLSPHCLRPEKA